jgi:hypothetical protein
MQIFIKNNGKTIDLYVEGSDNIGIIKQKIYEKEGYPVDLQRIILSGKEVNDENTVEELMLYRMNHMHLVLKKDINI